MEKRLGNIYGEDRGTGFAGNVWDTNAVSPTLTTMQGGGRQPMIIENVIVGGMQENQSIKKDGVCTCLTSSMGMGGGYVPMVVDRNEDLIMANETGVCRIEKAEVINPLKGLSDNGWHFEQNVYDSSGLVRAVKAGGGSGNIPKVIEQYRIRKLTPKECWRLMDFSDEDFHKAEAANSNTHLYKQAGNSIVRNVLVAIFGQMIPGKEEVYKDIQKGA